jgi:hypothetical protein
MYSNARLFHYDLLCSIMAWTNDLRKLSTNCFPSVHAFGLVSQDTLKKGPWEFHLSKLYLH